MKKLFSLLSFSFTVLVAAFFVTQFIDVSYAVAVPVIAFLALCVKPADGILAASFVTLNNLNEREIFANSVAALQRAFSDVPGFNARNYKLTQSYLRLEQAIVAGITTYRFPVLVTETQTGIFTTEKRLNLQDSFVTSSILIGTYVSASATGEILTWEDPAAYSTSGADVAVKALYNGSLEIKVNNDVLTPDWDVWRHYDRPASPLVSNDPTANNGITGFFPMEPNIILVGAKNNKVSINLPEGIGTVQANSRIVLLLRGILAQNTTVVA